MIQKEHFFLEMTGADALAQNAIAESPNKYLANMMRCLLHASNLGLEYWSFTLIHDFYIKNRLPYCFTKTTPFEALTGYQLNLTNIIVFGSRLYVRKPGKCEAKLNHHTYNGIFIGYNATTKDIYYINKKSNNIKMGTHALFDEAHFIVHS